jgi:hypothetical protein
MTMNTMIIGFPPEKEGEKRKDHFDQLLLRSREILQSYGHIVKEYPDILEIHFECPADHVDEVLLTLAMKARMSIVATIMPPQCGKYGDIGGEG